jgi:hypothetical protein
MNGFDSNDAQGVRIWFSSPDDQTAHDSILIWLRQHVHSFLAVHQCNNSVKGNLGEAISFCIGLWHHFSQHYPFPANALNPLSGNSSKDVDLVWIYFGQTEQQDSITLQEVKTTGNSSLAIASSLIDDYEKLFGTNPAFTLHTRLQAIKNKLEYEVGRADLCDRVDTMAGVSPATCTRIFLMPTLVHERQGAAPGPKLLTVKAAIAAKGWLAANITCCAVGLFDLDARLLRLAMGNA